MAIKKKSSFGKFFDNQMAISGGSGPGYFAVMGHVCGGDYTIFPYFGSFIDKERNELS